MSIDQLDARHEAFKEGVIKLNLAQFGRFLKGDAGHLTRGVASREVNGRVYGESFATFRAGQTGDIRSVDVRQQGNTDLLSGSVSFGYPNFEIRKDVEPEEAGVLITNIACHKDSANYNEEARKTLEESAFCFNILNSKSVRDLFTTLDLYTGEIFASGKRKIEKDDFKRIIIEVVEGKRGLEYITHNHGLYDKVSELKGKFDAERNRG